MISRIHRYPVVSVSETVHRLGSGQAQEITARVCLRVSLAEAFCLPIAEGCIDQAETAGKAQPPPVWARACLVAIPRADEIQIKFEAHPSVIRQILQPEIDRLIAELAHEPFTTRRGRCSGAAPVRTRRAGEIFVKDNPFLHYLGTGPGLVVILLRVDPVPRYRCSEMRRPFQPGGKWIEALRRLLRE